jgi:Holliday junction resolvase RusA-like endonuclease
VSAAWEFSLPPPPSVNRTRVINYAHQAKYEKWCTAAGWCMKEQGFHVGEPIECAVEVILRFPRTADLDNRIKAVLDLMTKMRLYRDDRQVQRIVAEFHDGDKVAISIRVL